MYEKRYEAIQALTPKSERPATEATAPESWNFVHLAVTRTDGVIWVQFKGPQIFQDAVDSDLREDLARLADLLGRDSKILLDFSGISSINAASISALAQFNKNLQTKGSRMALCCLEPTTRESFFESRCRGTALRLACSTQDTTHPHRRNSQLVTGCCCRRRPVARGARGTRSLATRRPDDISPCRTAGLDSPDQFDIRARRRVPSALPLLFPADEIQYL
jgi:hypothetical protein